MAEDDLDHHAPPSNIATLIEVLPKFNNKASEMTQNRMEKFEYDKDEESDKDLPFFGYY